MPDYAVFEEGKWTGIDVRLMNEFNAALREHPVPPGHPHPERHILEVARQAYPHFRYFRIKVVREEDEAASKPPMPKWMRFLTGE